ncbi:MAG TPA: AraD1 family protein [Acidobacteriaceae bacterium]|jgi:hypothetical protein
MIHLVQISNGTERRVAMVEEPHLRCLEGVRGVYELVQRHVESGSKLSEQASALASGELLDYEAIYAGRSEWRLLAPIDVPDQPSRVLVSGTGLTHLGSARERQAMHLGGETKPAEAMTDSMRMFEWGVEGGRPAEGAIGTAPEWFYKGDGSVLRGPGEVLEIPGFAEDGGEEAEIAGVYLIDGSGRPCRVGMVQGNEFSDHKFEKRNYLNLAGSKLRTCSIGPELVVGAGFADVRGEVRIERAGETVWHRTIASGEDNMCHSLANMEHHHFKFAGHRQPGSVHVHFFGADALSCGDGVVLRDGDVAEVRFDGFGRALRNVIREEAKVDAPVLVQGLS